MITGTVRDLPLLSGYLHDALFVPCAVKHDAERQHLRVPLERICYERAERGRFLGLCPIVRFPWIESVLCFTAVRAVEEKWVKRRKRDPGERQMLLEMGCLKSDVVAIEADELHLVVTVSPETTIGIDDIGKPSTRARTMDIGRGVFRSMAEIEKLRVVR
ncbi:hypothetical protein IT570_12345 [Candidatus Sumerlaeota bacterium]|nr:hypothetical protein [Candidatus Sumerlaeota bacterium]